MAYWIFKCNPERYKLTERMADPNPAMTWTVTRYRDDIKKDDIVFIWETGRKRGIRAVLRAEGIPVEMPELESEQAYWTEPTERDTGIHCRVRATITHRNVNLSHTHLRSILGLEKLSVFQGFQQGTNFEVSDEQGDILKSLISK